ncbi:hypothetical protein HMPREF0973_02539 [Prevotella veroralis F0319]|uniref:Uncharacterized protein n=1 Tax=Prevotella veroralis F0319 TaxID=649761 RepID=C9MSC1_9BACT|nr:hypothetical protein HMPREF0973_02539 [Prevotella veroralis F0319]
MMQGKPLFDVTERPLPFDEGISLFLLLLFLLMRHRLVALQSTTPSYANSTIHSPLHSERGRG